MPKSKTFLCIAIIMLLAIFLRFYDIKNVPPGLWTDEAMNGTNIIQALTTHNWKVFYPENFGREGLFINFQSLFVMAFGNHPWALRLPSALMGILTVFGLYLMAKELFSARIALFASFFLATSFWHINFSRIGLRAIAAPFFFVWGFYLLFKGIKEARSPRSPTSNLQRSRTSYRTRPEIIFALAGFVFGLGVHTYIAYRLAPIIALLPLWKFYKDWRGEVRLQSATDGSRTSFSCAPCLILLFIFMALVAASPLLLYFSQHPADFLGRTSAVSIFSLPAGKAGTPQPMGQFSENFVKTIQMFNLFGDFNWRHNYAGSPELWWPVGILFLIGIWQSLKFVLKNKSKAQILQDLAQRDGASRAITQQRDMRVFTKSDAEAIKPFSFHFILLWFVVMILPVALSNESLPHALRAIILILPAMIFAALGMEWLIIKIKNKIGKWKIDYPNNLHQIKRIEKELKILLFAFFVVATIQVFNKYFLLWAPNPHVYTSFTTNLTEKANWLNNEPQDIKKYIISGEVDHIDLTGAPMSVEPIVFITNTLYPDKQQEKNIYYLTLKDISSADCNVQCEIVPLEENATMFKAIKEKIPNLYADVTSGFLVFKK